MEPRFTKFNLQNRTMDFALRVLALVRALPRGFGEGVIAKQLAKSATSVGANYREASHAKSSSDFASKLKICESEADETLYWIEILYKSGIIKPSRLELLMAEAKELVAIFTAATRTAYAKLKTK